MSFTGFSLSLESTTLNLRPGVNMENTVYFTFMITDEKDERFKPSYVLCLPF